MAKEKTTVASDLNDLWLSMLKNREAIRNASIKYAVSTGVDECKGWKNMFREHLVKYDESLLYLRSEIVRNFITMLSQERFPGIYISSSDVLDKMVEALTDENSDSTVYDKPLVFDANWIQEYLEKEYFKNGASLCSQQASTRLSRCSFSGKIESNGSMEHVSFFVNFNKSFGGKLVPSQYAINVIRDIHILCKYLKDGGIFHSILFLDKDGGIPMSEDIVLNNLTLSHCMKNNPIRIDVRFSSHEDAKVFLESVAQKKKK